MTITIQKYGIEGATWQGVLPEGVANHLAEKMSSQPFYSGKGPEESKYGFVKCSVYQDQLIYGIFIQKFPTTLTNYDDDTKDEITERSIDSGEYFFLFQLDTQSLYLQLKRDKHLPPNEVVATRFETLLKLAWLDTQYGLSGIVKRLEEVDRDKILNIFYNEATTITELEFTDFDETLISEEKEKRGGKFQTYFNPIEEYQEAMEAGAIRFAQHTERSSIKAKPDQSLYKDPIARAMLEGSRKPIKIVYTKDGEQITDSAITRNKEIITIEADSFSDIGNEQIALLLDRLRGTHLRTPEKPTKIENTDQIILFDDL